MSDGGRPWTGQASERFLRRGMLVLFIQHLCIMPNGSFALLCCVLFFFLFWFWFSLWLPYFPLWNFVGSVVYSILQLNAIFSYNYRVIICLHAGHICLEKCFFIYMKAYTSLLSIMVGMKITKSLE